MNGTANPLNRLVLQAESAMRPKYLATGMTRIEVDMTYKAIIISVTLIKFHAMTLIACTVCCTGYVFMHMW